MTDIFGTFGPACEDAAVLDAMLANGLTGMRLNLSHVKLPQAAEQIRRFQCCAQQRGIQPKLLIDLQGPEVRVGALPEPLMLREGERVVPGETFPVPKEVRIALKPGQEILLDDGKLLLRCTEDGYAVVLRGGLLLSRKSIALLGKEIHLPALTACDLENLSYASELGVTGVMQPFVRSGADLQAVRRALEKAGCAHLRIYAKIESCEGMAALEEILPNADEVIIARGDLGNAMPLWELPAAQKSIASACRKARVPFMVVTQMLASMEQNAVPTRAEVSDIFNALLDGAASVMVTGETASGRYPAETIRYFSETVRSAERYLKTLHAEHFNTNSV